jgi:hypothetical protein
MAEYSEQWPDYGTPPIFVPAEFVPVGEAVMRGIDRKLGYLGDRRFVLFYYETQGQEVIWRDDQSYGFGAGGWREFTQGVWPLSGVYEVCVGNDDGRGGDVLVIDRVLGLAYFAPRTIADVFIDEHGQDCGRDD